MIVTPCSHAYHRNDVLLWFLVHESICVHWSWYHIVRFHPPFCCDPYCCNPPWQLKAVRGWFSVYRSQNVCQTFLTLHHSLGELHQPHSIFRLWETPMTHAPLMTSPPVGLTAPLPNQAFPWPGWPRHLVVTGCLCLCHKGSRTLHKASWTKKPYQQSLNMLKGLASPVTCQKRVAWLRLSLVSLAWLQLSPDTSFASEHSLPPGTESLAWVHSESAWYVKEVLLHCICKFKLQNSLFFVVVEKIFLKIFILRNFFLKFFFWKKFFLKKFFFEEIFFEKIFFLNFFF